MVFELILFTTQHINKEACYVIVDLYLQKPVSGKRWLRRDVHESIKQNKEPRETLIQIDPSDFFTDVNKYLHTEMMAISENEQMVLDKLDSNRVKKHRGRKRKKRKILI